MKINIEQIPEDGLAFEYEQLPEEFPVVNEMVRSGECRFEKPISYRLEVKRFGQIIDIRGDFSTTVQLACSRCLQPFRQPLQALFRIAFSQHEPFSAQDIDEGTDIELTADELGVIPFSGEEIDLADILQEEVVMALPMQPLCRKSCKGLCPQCGADLNNSSCGCRKLVVNSKFAALKGLKLDK